MEKTPRTMCQQDIQEAIEQNHRAFDQLEQEARAREALREPVEHKLFPNPFVAGEIAGELLRRGQ